MSTPTPQILIPIDFSEQSYIALDQSHRLAKFYNADLTIIHVVEDAGGLGSIFKKKPSEEELKKEAKAKLDEMAAATSKKHNIKINTVVDAGRIFVKILELADKIEPKLILMGTHTPSNGYKVVRAAKCPVITIKGKNIHEGCRNILVPLDLTKESREKVKNAIELGNLYKASVYVVSVLYSLDKDAAFKLTKQVEHVKKFIEAAGVKCSTDIIETAKKETLAESIVNFAQKKEKEIDIIMLMTQQEGQSEPLFISSTAQAIIDTSDIPVMSIVPSPKRAGGFSPY